jgi:hypothetical protein
MIDDQVVLAPWPDHTFAELVRLSLGLLSRRAVWGTTSPSAASFP